MKTFSFSLSKNGDSIPMWNYYSDKLGVTIGLCKQQLIQALRGITVDYYAFSPCDLIYKRDDQYQLIKEQLNKIHILENNEEYLFDDISKTLKTANNIIFDEHQVIKSECPIRSF